MANTDVRVDAMVSCPAPKLVIAIFFKYVSLNSDLSLCSWMRSASKSCLSSLAGSGFRADLSRRETRLLTSGKKALKLSGVLYDRPQSVLNVLPTLQDQNPSLAANGKRPKTLFLRHP